MRTVVLVFCTLAGLLVGGLLLATGDDVAQADAVPALWLTLAGFGVLGWLVGLGLARLAFDPRHPDRQITPDRYPNRRRPVHPPTSPPPTQHGHDPGGGWSSNP